MFFCSESFLPSSHSFSPIRKSIKKSLIDSFYVRYQEDSSSDNRNFFLRANEMLKACNLNNTNVSLSEIKHEL
jgi:hypothetical protein